MDIPRSGWVKSASGDRLPDRVGVEVLTRVFPPDVVDSALVKTGRVELRKGPLPERLVMYFVVGMGLFGDASYEEVLRQLTEGLTWLGVESGSRRREDGVAWEVPSKAAIFRARDRWVVTTCTPGLR